MGGHDAWEGIAQRGRCAGGGAVRVLSLTSIPGKTILGSLREPSRAPPALAVEAIPSCMGG